MNTETQKLRDTVHVDTGLMENRDFNRLKIKYHKLMFYPPHNGNWITHGRHLTMIMIGTLPMFKSNETAWLLSRLIFFKNLSTWEYMLTVRTMVYLKPVNLAPPSSSSSSKPPYLSTTCSTTLCHKNYVERPQNIETRRKKKIEQEKLEGKSLMIRSTLSINSVSEWRQTLQIYVCLELNQQVEFSCWHI